MNDGIAFPFAISMIFVMMGVDTAVTVIPHAEMAQFFEVTAVKATRHGDGAILEVDRTIHLPLHMEFSVRVQEETPRGWIDVCAMSSGVILYQPDAALPDPVTLDWWTWGECPTIPAGHARIVTTWTPEPRGLAPISIVTEVKG